MTRRALRTKIFEILFKLEFNKRDEMQEQMKYSLDRISELSCEDEEYIIRKTKRIIELLEDIDAMIDKASDGWSVKRLGKAELAILRLAVYEMKYDDEIPYKVAINEAVELAKIYCDEDAKAFINGVLSNVNQ